MVLEFAFVLLITVAIYLLAAVAVYFLVDLLTAYIVFCAACVGGYFYNRYKIAHRDDFGGDNDGGVMMARAASLSLLNYVAIAIVVVLVIVGLAIFL